MNNAPALLRTLIIFAVIVPLALFIGYLLANPMDISAFVQASVLGLVLVFPLLLRWHHPLLILSWNSGVFVFFLPGRPDLWLVMTVISLCISLLQRALGGVKQLVGVPQVTWPLVFLIGVVVITAKLTGMGLHTFGDEISGGRRYISFLVAIMGYFALSSHRIPPERAGLFVGLFFLPGLLAFMGDLWPVIPEPLHFIYLFFPAYAGTVSQNPFEQSTRLAGGMLMAINVFYYMQARYGIRGIFLSRKPWRWMLLVIALGYGLLGGFRSTVILVALIFVIQFFLEGLHRTKLLVIFAVVGVFGATALVPLAPHLPRTAQRALSFLPLNIDPAARQSAEESSTWRFDMWKALLPQVPQHLLLGKGYAMSRLDIDLLGGSDAAIRSTFAENQLYALNGTYHSGPFSVVMTFGIWGVITVVWFWVAGLWVLCRNYRYGDPALRTVNTFLLAAFVARIIFFILIFGGLDTDFPMFAGYLGLSVSLNGGVCRPAPEPVRATNKFKAFGGVRAHLQPTFRRP
jgi:hypothetical protein